ncbi:hypothetical protein Fbal_1464 [Ferrimonas balearica DSM 9799]|uniref:Uncharacterized protein n=1 Tax=Ferrimonas balearica (strain DSM 9799 / CCM 4581 / KCTC 23876 / PAT) TaxID=550540 RepID=E1SNI4_FERBD|nr:hypothetical protein Fbal_1464 [Ferrimonas balearica DSM 9799]
MFTSRTRLPHFAWPASPVFQVGALVVVLFLVQWVPAEVWAAYPELAITQRFLCDVAPRILLLCLMLALVLHLLERSLYKHLQRGGAVRLPFSLSTGLFVVLFGCSKLLMLVQSRIDQFTRGQRLALLTIALSSAGGLSSLALSAVGYPLYQLLLANLLLTALMTLMMLPLMGGGRQDNLLLRPDNDTPFRTRCLAFLSGGSKLVVNMTLVISVMESLLQRYPLDSVSVNRLVWLPERFFTALGFSPEYTQALAYHWVVKNLVNRDMAMIGLAEEGWLFQMPTIEQFLVVTQFVSIVGVSTVLIIGLNIIAMFGRKGWPLFRLMPLAVVLSTLLPLVPVLLLTGWR